MLWKDQALFAEDVAKLINYIASQNMFCTFGEAFRTQEQADIYAKEGKGIHNSLHCQRLAIDLNLYSSDGEYLEDYKSYEKIGIYFESLNSENKWGGRFKRVDSNHFERNPE